MRKHRLLWMTILLGWALSMGIMAQTEEDSTQIDIITEEETEVIPWEWEEIPWETEQSETIREEWTEEIEEENRQVRISNIRFLEGEGYKIYDGTCDVNLIFEVSNLPEDLEVILRARTEKSDVGRYPVMIEANLYGENAGAYELVMEPVNLEIEIRPRPLFVTISNARKPYYQELLLENLIFEETEFLRVEGFLKDQDGNALVPENFTLPKLMIDGSVLTKESPMYHSGREWFYEGAITITEDNDKKCGNYYYLPEDPFYTKKGEIILTQPYIEEGKDYRLYADGNLYVGENGMNWISPGTKLEIVPQPGSGFTQGVVLGPLYESGSREFSLSATDKEGYLSAISQVRSVIWNVDAQAPEGYIQISAEGKKDNVIYTDKDIVAQITGDDSGSGIQSIMVYLAKDEQCMYDPELVYAEHADMWQEIVNLTLTEEGRYCVFARFQDRVRNVSYQKSNILVIDRKKPTLTIENIQDGSANKGTVLPVIIAQDKNLDYGSLQFTMMGFKNGKQEVIYRRQKAQDQEKISMADFPKEKEWDDVYQLEVTAQDLAGNTADKKIRFSVNRFGSTYYIEESEKFMQNYYLNKPVDIIVREVNVDALVETSIMIGYEDTVRFLEKDTDYEMTLIGDEKSHKEYRYRIPAEEFQKDGHYYVVFSSKDEANNLGDNRMGRKNVEFAVDTRSPLLVLAGIEDGAEYDTARVISLECIENMELDYVHFLVDGEEKGDGKSISQKIILNEKDGWQHIRVTARDKAGNESQYIQKKIYIGKEKVVKETEMPETGKVIKENVKIVQKEQNSFSADPQEEGRWRWEIPGIAVLFLVFYYLIKN